MKLMFRMLIDKKVFYKLIILFLMGLARDAQSARLNLRCLCDISRKKTGMKLQINCTAWFKSWSYNSLYIQCSPTIDPFLLLIWNPCQAFSAFDCLYNKLIFIVSSYDRSLQVGLFVQNLSFSDLLRKVCCGGIPCCCIRQYVIIL